MGLFDRSFHELLNRYQSIKEQFAVYDDKGQVIGYLPSAPKEGEMGFKAVTKGVSPAEGTPGIDDFEAVTKPGGGQDSKPAAPAAVPTSTPSPAAPAAPTTSSSGGLPTPEEHKDFLKKQADSIRATDPERAKYIDMQAARTDQNAAVASTGGASTITPPAQVATGEPSAKEKELLKKFHASDYNPSSKTDQARLQELRTAVAASGGNIEKADPEKLRAMSYAQQYKGTPQGEAYAKKAGADMAKLVGVNAPGPVSIGQPKPTTAAVTPTTPSVPAAPAAPTPPAAKPATSPAPGPTPAAPAAPAKSVNPAATASLNRMGVSPAMTQRYLQKPSTKTASAPKSTKPTSTT